MRNQFDLEYHATNCLRSWCQYDDPDCPVKAGDIEGHIDLTNQRDRLVSIIFAAKEAALEFQPAHRAVGSYWKRQLRLRQNQNGVKE